MSGKHSREKGKRGERELAKLLSTLFGLHCRRGQQYSGIDGQDVVGLPGVHIECKRTETFNMNAALEQAERDAYSAHVPVVCHRKNGGEWTVVLRLEYLPALIRRLAPVVEHKDKADEWMG